MKSLNFIFQVGRKIRRNRVPSLRIAITSFTLLASLFAVHAADVECVMDVKAVAAGAYDRLGEQVNDVIAGRTAVWPERDSYRSYFVYRIPQFTGTLTKAEFVSTYYYGVGAFPFEQLRLSAVTNSIGTLVGGGLSLSNVHADLGDGTVFGEDAAPINCCSTSVYITLNSNALTAIDAARGSDFAMGGALSSLPPDDFNGTNGPRYIRFPYSTLILRLTFSAPMAPVIHTPLSVSDTTSNTVIGTFGVSGSTPMTYRWFVGLNSNITTMTAYDSTPRNLFFYNTPANSTQYVSVVAFNSFGSVTSQWVQYQVPPASVTLSESNIQVRAASSFSVYASVFSRSVPSGYSLQWYKDGVPEFGRVYNYLPFGAITTNESGNYVAVISNAAGVVTSGVVRIRVSETAPVFWQQPRSVSASAGTYLEMRGYAQAGPAALYRWFRDGAPLVSGSNWFLIFPSLQLSDSGDYFVVASNHVGAITSRVAHLDVRIDPPVFTVHPTNQTVYFGRSPTLRVQVGGYSSTLRWYHSNTLVTSSTSATLNITNATDANAGPYFCVASNSAGVATSQVATITIVSVPPVMGGPVDTNKAAGSTFSWFVSLANPPARLTLVFEETNIVASQFTSSTAPSFTLTNLQPGQAGQYYVIGSNQFGVSTSRVATLSVSTAPPVVSIILSASNVVEGMSLSIQMYGSGAPLPQLFLYHNGTPVLGGFSQPYSGGVYRFRTFSAVSLADAGDYTVVASNSLGIASATARLNVQRAGPLDKWTVRNPLPQGRDLHSVAFGQDQFVAVGDSGALVTSPDGTNWTVRNSHTHESFYDVAYGNDRFVTVGRSGSALVSTNGETWQANVIETNAAFNAITFGDGHFLAAGRSYATYTAVAYRSTNGFDWERLTVVSGASSDVFEAATYGAGTFLILDSYGTAYSSTDLTNWLSRAAVVPYATDAAYLTGIFVALAYDGYLNISLDGNSWGEPAVNGANTRTLYGAAYGSGRYVIVCSKGKIIASTGSLNAWSEVTSPTTDRLEDVLFAKNIFVAVGENGTILTSNNGLSWTNQTRGVNHDLDGLAVGDGLAVAVGKNGTILTSVDGTTWAYHLSPGEPVNLHGVAYGDGKWVVVGQSSNILVSTDAMNWQAHTQSFGITYLKSVIYGSNLWVAVGVGGQIITSTDAITWTPAPFITSYDLNEVTFGDGQFVAVGDNNIQPNATILTSSNGLQWANHSFSGPGKNARAIAFANGLYVVPLNDGGIIYATNSWPSFSWQYAVTGVLSEGNNLRGSTWSNALWVTIGNRGIILTSTNAASWRQRLSPTYENLHAVRYINNTFIAIGNEGIILQSAPLTSQLFAERVGADLRLTYSSPYEGIFKLQQTEDFATWEDAAWLTNLVGTVERQMPAGSEKKFYRVVLP